MNSNKKPDELMNWHDKRAKERGHILLLFALIACPAREPYMKLLIHSFILSFQLKIKTHLDEQGRQAGTFSWFVSCGQFSTNDTLFTHAVIK